MDKQFLTVVEIQRGSVGLIYELSTGEGGNRISDWKPFVEVDLR